MDVRQYFRKIRETEATISEDYPIVISLETGDGGKAGLLSEVSRSLAAKMMVEGRVMLATAEQKQKYFDDVQSARTAAEQADFARKLHLSIIEDSSVHTPFVTRKHNGPSGNGK
jgi:hypothetical protein